MSGDSEVPLPTGYGTFLRVDEFKAILFGGATRTGRRNDTYYLIMPKHLSDHDQWVRQCVLESSLIVDIVYYPKKGMFSWRRPGDMTLTIISSRETSRICTCICTV